LNGTAVINFVGEGYSTTIMYPEVAEVTLVEGEYNISVYVYGDSSLKLPGYSEEMCVNVPVAGIGGLVGLEEEKCYDVTVPAMEVEMAVVGGGNAREYVAESMLSDSMKLNLDVQSFGEPNSLEELQENYARVEEANVFLEFE